MRKYLPCIYFGACIGGLLAFAGYPITTVLYWAVLIPVLIVYGMVTIVAES